MNWTLNIGACTETANATILSDRSLRAYVVEAQSQVAVRHAMKVELARPNQVQQQLSPVRLPERTR